MTLDLNFLYFNIDFSENVWKEHFAGTKTFSLLNSRVVDKNYFFTGRDKMSKSFDRNMKIM